SATRASAFSATPNEKLSDRRPTGKLDRNWRFRVSARNRARARGGGSSPATSWAAGKGQSVQGGEELLMALEDWLRFYLPRFKCPDTLFVAPSQNDPVPTREHVEVARC